MGAPGVPKGRPGPQACNGSLQKALSNTGNLPPSLIPESGVSTRHNLKQGNGTAALNRGRTSCAMPISTEGTTGGNTSAYSSTTQTRLPFTTTNTRNPKKIPRFVCSFLYEGQKPHAQRTRNQDRSAAKRTGQRTSRKGRDTTGHKGKTPNLRSYEFPAPIPARPWVHLST